MAELRRTKKKKKVSLLKMLSPSPWAKIEKPLAHKVQHLLGLVHHERLDDCAN